MKEKLRNSFWSINLQKIAKAQEVRNKINCTIKNITRSFRQEALDKNLNYPKIQVVGDIDEIESCIRFVTNMVLPQKGAYLQNQLMLKKIKSS